MNVSRHYHHPRRFRNRQWSDRSFANYLASILVVTVALIVNTDCFFASSFQTKQNAAARKDHGNYQRHHDHSLRLLSSSSNTSPSTTNAETSATLGAPICVYHQVGVPSSEPNPVPRQAISVEDLTPTLQKLLEESGMKNGLVTVISRHTTTSLTINEWESRLAQDIAESLLQLVPPDERSSSPASQKGVTYKHNDIHLRPFGGGEEDCNDYNTDSEEAQRCRENGWDVDDLEQLQAWRDQEPINSHSHLLSILAGSSSESIPIVDGKMVLGQWQSVLLLDLDGPRDRTVGVQLMGYT